MEMMVVDKGSGAWNPLTPSWMPCGRGSVGAFPNKIEAIRRYDVWRGSGGAVRR